jgi:hypothetical protein
MDWDFGDVILTMLAFFFWVMFIWMFISVFADIFRRQDLSGLAKAGWLLLIVCLPFLGILIYTIVRPSLPQDAQMLETASQTQEGSGQSVADEIAKLVALRDKGAISEDEFNRLKAKAIS